MSLEIIKQEIKEQGKDPNDFNIEINDNGYSVTPKWFYETKQIAKQEDGILKMGIDLASAINTVESLELISALNELQKLEQAQSNTEIVELMMMMGGM